MIRHVSLLLLSFNVWWSFLKKREVQQSELKVVVGLGNPGKKYEQTRHNVGFEVIARLTERFRGAAKSRFSGDWTEVSVRGHRVGLLQPATYMNRSGSSVAAVVAYYKLPLHQLLVVCDDFQLEIGRVRLRPTGSAGGQKGLADIIDRLNTENFARLRIGIGAPPPQWDAADFVLGRFTPAEREMIHSILDKSADAVEDWVDQGVDFCMNKYNAR